jgi:hypothetical protein
MLYKVLAAALALSCVHARALPVDDAASQHLAPEHLTTTFGASMLEGKMAKKSMSVWPKKVATKDDQSRWTKDMLKAEKDDSIARKSTVAAMRVAAQSVHAMQGTPTQSSQYAQTQASTSATGASLEAACVKCEESEGKLTSTLGGAIEKHEKFENVEYHFTKILHAENKLKETCAAIEGIKPKVVVMTNEIKESLARVKLGVDSGFTFKLNTKYFDKMNDVFGKAKKDDQLLTMTKDKSKGTCPEACSKADMDTATEAKDAADQEADAAKGDREKACEGIGAGASTTTTSAAEWIKKPGVAMGYAKSQKRGRSYPIGVAKEKCIEDVSCKAVSCARGDNRCTLRAMRGGVVHRSFPGRFTFLKP